MTEITITEASMDDLPAIIALLANDTEGAKRELDSDPLLQSYIAAFNEIQSDENADIIVVRCNTKVIGVSQINFITNLTYKGGVRAHIEGVRVHAEHQSQGIGQLLFEYLIKLAKKNHCHLVQLTTDKSRKQAYSFYKKLGFNNTHEGFKLHLK